MHYTEEYFIPFGVWRILSCYVAARKTGNTRDGMSTRDWLSVVEPYSDW